MHASDEIVPRKITYLGVVLAATAALPVAPDGRSFLHYVAEAFGRSLLEGVLMIVGFGSPFLFGLAVAIATLLPVGEDPEAKTRGETSSRVVLVRGPVAMMHSQLLLVAWAVWRHGEAIAAGPMFLFAIGSAIYMVTTLGRGRAGGEGPSLLWHVRWGAMVVAAVCMWARIQMFGVVKLGVAIDAAWLCAAGMILATRLSARSGTVA